MGEPVWIRDEVVLAIHARQLAEHGGAAYAFGIARNHPFVDGNKRTAFVVCLVFLRLNGLDLDAGADEKFQIFLNLAAGTISEAGLGEWIRAHLKLRPS